jgi:hypothetical protein
MTVRGSLFMVQPGRQQGPNQGEIKPARKRDKPFQKSSVSFLRNSQSFTLQNQSAPSQMTERER